MESTGYSLTDQSPAAEDSGYRYADPEQIRTSIPLPSDKT